MESYQSTAYTETEPLNGDEVTELVARLSEVAGDPGESATLGAVAEATGAELSVAARALHEIRYPAVEPPPIAWQAPEVLAPPRHSSPVPYQPSSDSTVPGPLLIAVVVIGIICVAGLLNLSAISSSRRYDPSQHMTVSVQAEDGDITRAENGDIIVKLKKGGSRPATASEIDTFTTLDLLTRAKRQD